jgi:hypothetical protein
MVLPRSVRGNTLSFFENQVQVQSGFVAKPGGPVDVRFWPKRIGRNAPRGLASLVIPGR